MSTVSKTALIYLRTCMSYVSLAPGDGKKRDPGNKVAIAAIRADHI